MIQTRRLNEDLLVQIISVIKEYGTGLLKNHPLLEKDLSNDSLKKLLSHFDLSDFYQHKSILIYKDNEGIEKPYPPGIYSISPSGRFAVIQNELFYNYVWDEYHWDDLCYSVEAGEISEDEFKELESKNETIRKKRVFDLERFEFVDAVDSALWEHFVLVEGCSIEEDYVELYVDEENCRIVLYYPVNIYVATSETGVERSVYRTWKYEQDEDGSIIQLKKEREERFLDSKKPELILKGRYFTTNNHVLLDDIFFLTDNENYDSSGNILPSKFIEKMSQIRSSYKDVEEIKDVIDKIIYTYEFVNNNSSLRHTGAKDLSFETLNEYSSSEDLINKPENSSLDSMIPLLAQLHHLRQKNKPSFSLSSNSGDDLPF